MKCLKYCAENKGKISGFTYRDLVIVLFNWLIRYRNLNVLEITN